MFSIFWPFKLLKFIVGLVLSTIIYGACALTAVAFFADKGFFWDLSTHFRMQYLVIQVIGLVLAIITLKMENKSKVEVLLTVTVLAFFIGLNGVAVGPYYLSPKPQRTDLAAGKTVEIMHFNVLGLLNRQQKAVATAIRNENPEMVDLMEYTPEWRQKLEATGVFKGYPYRIAGQGNIALYSKIPLRGQVVYAEGTKPLPQNANIRARFQLNGQSVNLLVAHPISPFLPGRWKEQQASFNYWINHRKTMGENLILMGDLNTTPWSSEFKRLIAATHLRDSQLGFGIQGSWPTIFIPFDMAHTAKATPNNILAPLAIPIDHALVSEKLLVVSRRLGPFVGSDHLPVVVEIGLKK